jgi:hypothetical protein
LAYKVLAWVMSKRRLGRRNWGFRPAQELFSYFFKKKPKNETPPHVSANIYMTNNLLTIAIKQPG